MDRDRLQVPRAVLRAEFYGPERAHVRDVLRAAARERNALGETDLEPAPVGRRGPWAGGWWD